MPVNYLSAENLSKSFNEKVLFNELTFGIEQGQKVALVGVNGCGKSTLLNIIGGLEKPDVGVVSFQRELKISYLSQSPQFNPDDTIADTIFQSNNVEAKLLKDYYRLLEKTDPTASEQDELQNVLEQIDSLNAWDYESRAKDVLGKLGIHDLDLKIGPLSGGQKKRIAIASVLVHKPDFLILDEPTNHLDLDVIEWLEEYLSVQNMALLMVTHDRYFLDKVTTQIYELDKGTLFKYKGNYSRYLEQKGEREEIEQKAKDKAKNLMSKELEWMRRQPKARGTKAQYRIDAFYDLQDKATVDLSKNELEIKVSQSRQGKKILELKKLSKSFGEMDIFKDFSYVFRRGEKIGVVGKNGTGKSTFLNVLTGHLDPDAGLVEPGINTKFGYYTQGDLKFNEGQKVIDVVKEVAEVITLDDGSVITASQFLNLFLFPPATQHSPISKLSGGEKRRLQLLQVLIANPNFLILDEPTNDLDIVTLNVLEDYLHKFSGCLILVSHDRYFMDRLVDHLFLFDKDTAVTDFPGNYTDFRLLSKEKPTAQNSVKESESKAAKVKKKDGKKLSFKEQREFEGLEKDISKLEGQKAVLVEKLNSGESEHSVLSEWAKDVEVINQSLEEKEMRWLELSERV